MRINPGVLFTASALLFNQDLTWVVLAGCDVIPSLMPRLAVNDNIFKAIEGTFYRFVKPPGRVQNKQYRRHSSSASAQCGAGGDFAEKDI